MTFFVLPRCVTITMSYMYTVAFEEKYGSQLELIFRFIDRGAGNWRVGVNGERFND